MLEWIKEDITFLTLAITIVGGGFALWQWRKQNKIRRTEFVYQVMNDLRHDQEIVEISHAVAYGEFLYNENFHDDHALEIKIDKLLGVLNLSPEKQSNWQTRF